MSASQAERACVAALARAGFTVGAGSGGFLWTHLANPRGDRRAAEAAYLRWLEAEPNNEQALEAVVFLLRIEGRLPEAIPFRKRLLELQVKRRGVPRSREPEVLEFLLAREGLAPQPARPPLSYVGNLFDNYAESFDEHLTDRLQYRGPQLLHEAVLRAIETPGKSLDVLDAGCGTGLAGPLFRPLARRLDGIDLSAAMLQKARERKVYDSLERGDWLEILARRPAAYDLLIAADVLVYFGDLRPVFAAARACLRTGGLFAFSAERGEESDYRLCNSGRYIHSSSYIRSEARANGLCELSVREDITRQEHAQPVVAFVVVLRADDSV